MSRDLFMGDTRVGWDAMGRPAVVPASQPTRLAPPSLNAGALRADLPTRPIVCRRDMKMRKPHRAEFIKAGVSAAMIAAGAVVCIVIITHADLDHKSVLDMPSLDPIKGGKKVRMFALELL